MSARRASAGLFGKTPAVGDFLRLDLPAAALGALDVWLEAGLATLAGADADWRTPFGQAPVWRFVAAHGAGGPAALAGVVGPSRDRVGRAFPCLVAAVLDEVDAAAAVACTPWFDRAEAFLADARGGTSLEDLHRGLEELGAPLPDDLDVLSLRARSTDDGLFLDVRSGPDGRAVTLQAVLETSPLAPTSSLWWRHTGRGAKVLLTPGLPRREAFSALFRGQAAEPASAAPAPSAPAPAALPPLGVP